MSTEDAKVKQVLNKLDGIDDRNMCKVCGGDNLELRNYDMMWHDGDIYCKDCNIRVRGYDAG